MAEVLPCPLVEPHEIYAESRAQNAHTEGSDIVCGVIYIRAFSTQIMGIAQYGSSQYDRYFEK